MAAILQSNNYDVKPALSALLKSEHFFDTINQACYIKSPFDMIVGTLREFNVSFPAYTDYTTGYPLFIPFIRMLPTCSSNYFSHLM